MRCSRPATVEGLGWTALFLAGACAAPRPAGPRAPTAPLARAGDGADAAVTSALGGAGSAAAGAPLTATGQLVTRYRGRFAGNEDDHDAYQTLDLAVRQPGVWSATVMARAALDLDGRDDAEDADFFSLMDTYEHSLEGQLYHAYVDVETTPLGLLRLGRQPIYETPVTLLIDGVRAESQPMGEAHSRLGAYAGVGEHPYESSSDGDTVLGAFGSTAPWTGASLRADWMHLEDLRLGVDHEDDLLGLSLRQDRYDQRTSSSLEARFTALGTDGRDLRLLGQHVDLEQQYSLQFSLYKLLHTQHELAAPLDPFSSSLLELFPYYQLALSGSKDWELLSLLGGADVRRVAHDDDVGEFNRDFERYFLTGSLPLPVVV